MKLKRQIKSYECGVAVVSMITNLSFKVCREQLGVVDGLGCWMNDIRLALVRNGCTVQIVQEPSERCVLRLQNPKSAQGSHFVLRWDGMTYDPDSGKSVNIPQAAEVLAIISSPLTP